MTFKRLPLFLSTLLACALLSGRIAAEEGSPAPGAPGQADKKEATSVILDKVPFRATFISTDLAPENESRLNVSKMAYWAQ